MDIPTDHGLIAIRQVDMAKWKQKSWHGLVVDDLLNLLPAYNFK